MAIVQPDSLAHVVFIVGPQQEKMLGVPSQLTAKSKELGDLALTNQEICYPDQDADAFGIFLKYINLDKLCFGERHVCELFRLAYFFQVPHLIKRCKEYAMATLTIENVRKYHLAAVMYELEELQDMAFRFMLREGTGFLKHPSFLLLDPITLASLIGRDDFGVVETDLFLRLLDWVDAECHRLRYTPDRKEFQLKVSGSLFQHVRFAMMTPKEFSSVVEPAGILSEKDVNAIRLRHVTPWVTWPNLEPSPFVDRPRTIRQFISVPFYNQVQVPFGYRRVNYPTAQESVRFLVSHDILLVGMELFGPAFNGPLTSYKVKYFVDNEVMTSQFTTPPETSSLLASSDFEIEFVHPIRISAQFPYRITVIFEGQISQFVSFPCPQAVIICNNTQISIHFADHKKFGSSINYHINFNMEPHSESPGVIKSFLFQTID